MVDVPVPIKLLVEHWREAERPAQEGILWPRERWLRAFGQHAELIEGLPERLDRGAVRAACLDAPIGQAPAVRAFLASMMWGYGPTGYGPWRTHRVLSQTPDAAGRLHEAARRLRNGGGLNAYRWLAGEGRIRWFGPAFATKYLYFCPQVANRMPALILDRFVAQWLHEQVDQQFHHWGWAPASYGGYVSLMCTWSDEIGLAPDVIEELIFVGSSQGRSTPRSTPDPYSRGRS